MLCREFGFHLAQEFFWWNPSRLPTPAEWVTVRRIRVKDAINCIWWLSPTPWPKASNRRVLQPYSESMKELLVKGYKPKMRPSGHDISDKFGTDNGAAIPPNLLALAHTESICWKLYNSSLRNGVREVLNAVNKELVIASPYIKTSEAEWVCDELYKRKSSLPIQLRVLTDVRSANVLSGSLDIKALNVFTERIPNSVVINLPPCMQRSMLPTTTALW